MPSDPPTILPNAMRLLAIICLLPSTCPGQIDFTKNQVVPDIRLADCPEPPIRYNVGVGDWKNYPNPKYYDYSENRQIYTTGFEIELIKAVCQQANYNCQLHTINSLDERITALIERKVDLVIWRLSFLHSRGYKVKFIEPYYYTDHAQLFKRGSKPPPENPSQGGGPVLEDLIRGKEVCVVAGYYLADELREKYGAKVIPVKNQLELGKNGKGQWKKEDCRLVMADFTDKDVLADMGYHAVQHQTHMLVNPYGIAVGYHNGQLAVEVANALRELFNPNQRTGKSRVQEIENTTLRVYDPSLPPSGYVRRQGELQKVITNAFFRSEYLRVGLVRNNDVEPFRFWRNSYQPQGFEHALATELCEMLNQRCIPIPLNNLDERISALQNNQVDIVISSFSVTVKRMLSVRFLEPFYFSAEAAFFTLQPKADELAAKAAKLAEDNMGEDEELLGKTLEGLRLCLQPGYFMQGRIQDQLKGKVTFVREFDLQRHSVALKEDICDVLVADDIYTFEYQRQGVHRIDNLPRMSSSPYAVAVSKDPSRQTLADQIARALQRLVYFNLESRLQQVINRELVQASNNSIRSNAYVDSFIELARVNQATCTEYVVRDSASGEINGTQPEL